MSHCIEEHHCKASEYNSISASLNCFTIKRGKNDDIGFETIVNRKLVGMI